MRPQPLQQRNKHRVLVTRRRLLRFAVGVVGAVLLEHNRQQNSEDEMMGRKQCATDAGEGRLSARPTPVADVAPTGLQPLGLTSQRDALVYVPPTYDPSQPAPFVLMLHGAGGTAEGGIAPLLPLADAAGLILLAPQSRGRTWDVILGGYGADVTFIDRALAEAFSHYAIEPARVVVAGFSDGASYALSLGLTNGDLFSHIVAFAPGFMVPAAQHGSPRIFITHGTQDQVLPIDRCSRRIVPQLQRAGYDVQYHEFEGGHTVPPSLAQQAADWIAPHRA